MRLENGTLQTAGSKMFRYPRQRKDKGTDEKISLWLTGITNALVSSDMMAFCYMFSNGILQMSSRTNIHFGGRLGNMIF